VHLQAGYESHASTFPSLCLSAFNERASKLAKASMLSHLAPGCTLRLRLIPAVAQRRVYGYGEDSEEADHRTPTAHPPAGCEEREVLTAGGLRRPPRGVPEADVTRVPPAPRRRR